MSQPTLHRRFFRLALLNILTNLTVPLVGLVDTAMLGHLDDIRFLAGVALASILFDYIYWSFGFLRMGATGTTAQAVGREDRAEVYDVLYRFVVLALVFGLGILALQWPLREGGFAMLSGEAGVKAAGRAYFDARIWGAPATLCNYALLGWYLGREQSRHALVMTVIANVCNVGLNYLFIVRLGMAAFGAGLATMISQYVMLLTGLAIFAGGGRPTAWEWARVLDRGKLGNLLRLNRDIMIRTFCLMTTFAVFTNFSSLMGTAILAANAILQRVLLLASYFIDGVAFAAESLVGIFHGAQDRVGLRRTVRLSLWSGLGFAGVFLAVFLPLQHAGYRVLTSHADVVELASRYGWWLVPVLAFGSLAYMYDGIFLGLTSGRDLRNSMLISTLLGFIPLACVALWKDNVDLLWLAMVVFMMVRSLTLGATARNRLATK